MSTIKYPFQACKQAQHEQCVGAYFDDEGRAKCSCRCHAQDELFAAHKVESIQRDMFKVMK